MGAREKLIQKILLGPSDANISFEDLRSLMVWLGFSEHIRGSHHVFRRDGIPEKINLQKQGSQAKPYQVRQVRALMMKHSIGGLQ